MNSTKTLFLILLINAHCINICAQDSNNENTSVSVSSDSFMNYVALDISIGNASSPKGFFGLALVASTDYVDLNLCMGWNNVRKQHLGLSIHPKSNKKFCPFLSADLGLTSRKEITFNLDDPDQRRYNLGNSWMMNYGVGLVWTPETKDKSNGHSYYFKVGYQDLISTYSICPEDPLLYDQSEVDDLFYSVFESRIFWSVGFRSWGN